MTKGTDYKHDIHLYMNNHNMMYESILSASLEMTNISRNSHIQTFPNIYSKHMENI